MFRARATSAVSSMSGYQRFSNSNDQQPASDTPSFSPLTAQSPGRRVSLLSSHSAALTSAGCDAGSPERRRAMTAHAVSQTGETAGCSRMLSASSTTKGSRPAMPLAIAGSSSRRPRLFRAKMA